jgi:hypothetical protein
VCDRLNVDAGSSSNHVFRPGGNTVGCMAASEVLIDGDVVVKTHHEGTDPRALAARLGIAERIDCFLSPLSTEPERHGTRWRTRWPRVETTPPDAEQIPWAEAAHLLARLHSHTVDGPPHGGPDRLRRALDALPDDPTAGTIRRAADRLPDHIWLAPNPGLVHGDWHLGQLGRRDKEWLLLDVDDLGVGPPAWDLARPAGFWAAGLIPDVDWLTFLDAYRDAHGAALPPAPADPWPALDPFARAAVIHAAARAATRGLTDEADALLIEACARMARSDL